SEGIEQGFEISQRPERKEGTKLNEPLRLVLSVTGDLRSRMNANGREIELYDKQGLGALSYSQLTAVDAGGRPLVSRMEVGLEGREIALVVEDTNARYPIIIDPITATLEQKLDAGANRLAEARFGFAVAI